ncbi:hypothetical protein [Seleniivibrio sp.]|uniref:hypothetical protein n=1 Tax=Seleniivibrio sp. TaxID=2898801 RepID=UPI0025E2C39A|nr:hypothetical protein [Seleniivibrio sp.]MCD8553232.1 hypothetical protein [Seleniivibrio sp.]
MNIISSENEIIISAGVVVLGWFVTHLLISFKSVRDDKRRIITNHLINAYTILTNDIAHRLQTDERSNKLEKLISQIQLFGDKKQVELVKKLADDVANGSSFELDPLINSLRESLRKSLGLKSITDNVVWLRFEKFNKK